MPRSDASVERMQHAMRVGGAWVRAFLAWLCWLALASAAHADVRVRVLETWPSGDSIVLAKGQNMYLRVAYSTDQPVQIWARPYWRGKVAEVATNPSHTYTGSGETWAWIAPLKPTMQVDEIRLLVSGATTKYSEQPVVWRGSLHADASVASGLPEPAWVGQMRAQDRALNQAPVDRGGASADQSSGWIEALVTGFMWIVLLLLVVGIGWPIAALRRWRGGWRIAAALPLAGMAFVVLRILFDGLKDPTSHNLWPFDIFIAGGASLIAMAVLWLLRRVLRGKEGV